MRPPPHGTVLCPESQDVPVPVLVLLPEASRERPPGPSVRATQAARPRAVSWPGSPQTSALGGVSSPRSLLTPPGPGLSQFLFSSRVAQRVWCHGPSSRPLWWHPGREQPRPTARTAGPRGSGLGPPECGEVAGVGQTPGGRGVRCHPCGHGRTPRPGSRAAVSAALFCFCRWGFV